MKKLIILLLSIVIFSSCNNSNWPTPEAADSDPGQNESSTSATKDKSAVVLEALDGGSYTYLRLSQNGIEFWAAISARQVEIGKKYYFKESVLMRDFESKQLQRTFDTILFIDYFGEQPSDAGMVSQHGSTQGHTNTDKEEDISIEHSGNVISLEELFGNKEKYKGEKIRVTGKVVKISKEIMDRDWIHIQDGTSFEGQYDLTVTLKTSIGIDLNSIVTFEGTISLDKDFGSGYFYPVIMEDAQVIEK